MAYWSGRRGRPGTQPLLLDEVMPRYQFREVHQIWVPAAPAVAYAVVKAVTPREIRLFAPLMAVRAAPSRLAGHGPELQPSAPLLEQFAHQGFPVLDERPPAELVIGGVGRFWRLTGDGALETVRTRRDFVIFDHPGYAKAALNFTVEVEEAGSRIVTETRVLGTDTDATRRFRRYWFAIRLGSAAIRKSWLKAIRQRIEREARCPP